MLHRDVSAQLMPTFLSMEPRVHRALLNAACRTLREATARLHVIHDLDVRVATLQAAADERLAVITRQAEALTLAHEEIATLRHAADARLELLQQQQAPIIDAHREIDATHRVATERLRIIEQLERAAGEDRPAERDSRFSKIGHAFQRLFIPAPMSRNENPAHGEAGHPETQAPSDRSSPGHS
jgi:hypothetical protein